MNHSHIGAFDGDRLRSRQRRIRRGPFLGSLLLLGDFLLLSHLLLGSLLLGYLLLGDFLLLLSYLFLSSLFLSATS